MIEFGLIYNHSIYIGAVLLSALTPNHRSCSPHFPFYLYRPAPIAPVDFAAASPMQMRSPLFVQERVLLRRLVTNTDL